MKQKTLYNSEVWLTMHKFIVMDLTYEDKKKLWITRQVPVEKMWHIIVLDMHVRLILIIMYVYKAKIKGLQATVNSFAIVRRTGI